MIRFVCLLACFVSSLAAAQPGPSVQLRIDGPPLSAIAGGWPSCGARDTPDAPARAIRLADGTVQLYVSDQDNRINSGPDLRRLQHRCSIVYRGAGNDDPAAFDDHSWLATPWTTDGRTIWALVHNEFHGQTRPALCPTRRYMDCWYNAVTLAVSTDEGRHFARASSHPLVAAIPYTYAQVGLGHHGYFNPTNIVRLNGAFYVMAFVTKAVSQQEGNCLLRTTDPTQPSTWRAWNGTSFDVALVDPYRDSSSPEAHLCSPIDTRSLRWPVTSLVQSAANHAFIALMQKGGRDGGIFYATSRDLVHWSTPTLLLAIPGLSQHSCNDPDAIAYPSLLDPDSTDANFQLVGAAPFLFATRFDDCRDPSRRTLIRWQINVQATAE